MSVLLEQIPDYCKIKKKCTQGDVGFCTFNGNQRVWKISKRVDFTCEGEKTISDIISNSTIGILPHFVKVKECLDVIPNTIEKHPRKCIFMERVDGCSLTSLIENKSDDIDIKNVVNQLLLTLSAAQQTISFTHYDLHKNNVLITTTNADVHVYIFPDDNVYTVETEGLCPVIIDYGYSYAKATPTLQHSTYFNSIGYTVCEYDTMVDCRTLLCSVTAGSANKLTKKVQALFSRIPCDTSTGWLEKFPNAAELIKRQFQPLPEMCANSIFRNELNSVIDIVQCLIPLPIVSTSFTPLMFKTMYIEFYSEWILIENTLCNEWLELLVLKHLVTFIIENPTMNPKKYIERKFPVLEDVEINYDILTVGVISMSKIINTVLNSIISLNQKTRDKYYTKVSTKTAIETYRYLNSENKRSTVYGKDDLLRVFDLRAGTTYDITLSKHDAKSLNKKTRTIEAMVL